MAPYRQASGATWTRTTLPEDHDDGSLPLQPVMATADNVNEFCESLRLARLAYFRSHKAIVL